MSVWFDSFRTCIAPRLTSAAIVQKMGHKPWNLFQPAQAFPGSNAGHKPTLRLTHKIGKDTVNAIFVGYRVDHRCIVCMKIKYTRGDQEIRPEWSDIYINLGRPTCDQSRKL